MQTDHDLLLIEHSWHVTGDTVGDICGGASWEAAMHHAYSWGPQHMVNQANEKLCKDIEVDIRPTVCEAAHQEFKTIFRVFFHVFIQNPRDRKPETARAQKL